MARSLRRLMTVATLGVTVGMTLPLAGCSWATVTKSEVRARFAEELSCPSVTLTERPDIVPASEAALFVPAPPSDIADNPERAAFWRSSQLQKLQSALGNHTAFTGEGCGVATLGFCLNFRTRYAGNQCRFAPEGNLASWFAKQACDKGAPHACTRVSMAKVTGDGVPKDVHGGLAELDSTCVRGEPSACAQLETSCSAGVLKDCDFLGERLLAGQGVPADRARALALLDKACRGGVLRACQKLVEAGAAAEVLP